MGIRWLWIGLGSLALAGVILVALVILSGSSRVSPARSFQLLNQYGEPVSLEQLRGKVVVLTFLYTHCPDACPPYFFKIQQAVNDSDSQQEAVALVVTVDPERDTVAGLREFSATLPGNWLFLTGTKGQLKTVWSNYGISVKKVGVEQAEMGHAPDYRVAHTLKVVLIDKQGNAATELAGNWPAASLAQKLTLLRAGEKIPVAFNPAASFLSFLYRCGPVTFATLGGAVAHFVLLLSIPAMLFALYRWLR